MRITPRVGSEREHQPFVPRRARRLIEMPTTTLSGGEALGLHVHRIGRRRRWAHVFPGVFFFPPYTRPLSVSAVRRRVVSAKGGFGRLIDEIER